VPFALYFNVLVKGKNILSGFSSDRLWSDMIHDIPVNSPFVPWWPLAPWAFLCQTLIERRCSCARTPGFWCADD
jgi:hypothetical protein